MISVDSVVALNNNFVTIDRLTGNQMLKGVSDSSPLLKIMEGMSEAYLLETKYFQIIASPHQHFIVNPTMTLPAEELRKGDTILTIYGFQPLDLVIHLQQEVLMADLIPQSRMFFSEGFILLSDNR